MDIRERQDNIIKFLGETNYLTVEQLAQSLGVSKVTIRTDLTVLEQKGLVKRTHGGAMIPEKSGCARLVSKTITEYETEKKAIAKRASLLIEDGQTVILDSGSTTSHLALFLAGRKITLVTNSLLVADAVRYDEDTEVILMGGSLRRNTMGLIGPLTTYGFSQIHANILFMGATGFTDTGIYGNNMIEAEVKREMLKAADKVCLVVDSSKTGKTAFSAICSWNDIDVLITDRIDSNLKDVISSHGVEVITAC